MFIAQPYVGAHGKAAALFISAAKKSIRTIKRAIFLHAEKKNTPTTTLAINTINT